jgi:hypothetical protein
LRDGHAYLHALCAAHLEIVNRVVQQYRLATYDYFPYEVSPLDVPTWQVDSEPGFVNAVLVPYVGWDYKPAIGPMGGDTEQYTLIGPDDFQRALTTEPTAGEFELLEAITLMERGDYSGAVRRITTALEAVLEARLRDELSKRYSDVEVVRHLRQNRNNFPLRKRVYEQLSGREMSATIWAEVERTRVIRNEIVHEGLRISFSDRGRAQRAVDTGRWAFNWFENKPDRQKVRETKLATRSVGRQFTLFEAELTGEGVVVHKPDFLDQHFTTNGESSDADAGDESL